MNNAQHARFHRLVMRTIFVTTAIAAVFMGSMIVLVVYQIGTKVLGL